MHEQQLWTSECATVLEHSLTDCDYFLRATILCYRLTFSNDTKATPTAEASTTAERFKCNCALSGEGAAASTTITSIVITDYIIFYRVCCWLSDNSNSSYQRAFTGGEERSERELELSEDSE